MAMTHDYLEFLDERIGISPANSEEEYQAAGVISDLMAQHNVEPEIEEFDTHSLTGLVPAVISIAALVGVVIAGFGVLVLTLIGLLLAAVPVVLSLMRLVGRSPRLTLGPRARSQNVVAVHRATGPLVTKGSRTIVIAAHYDAPRENFLYSSPVAPYLTLINRLSVPCSFVVAICTLIQLFGFLPDALRIIVWIVGILAGVVTIVPAVGAIAERTAPCTDGANDNKAGVAALLGILENVRPSGEKPKARPVPKPAEPKEPISEPAEVVQDGQAVEAVPASENPVAEQTVPVEGVRHGEAVLRALAILPESCEIDYAMPPAATVPPAAVAPAATAAPTAPASAPEADATAPVVPAERTAPVVDAPVAEPDATAGDQTDETRETGRIGIVMSGGGEGVGPQDSSGLTTMSDDFDADTTQPARAVQRPEAPSDPEWGKTSYRPQLSSVARRASLFDLPDPSAGEADPFATDPNATRVDPDATRVQSPATAQRTAPDSQVEPIETISAQAEPPAEQDAADQAPAESAGPGNALRSFMGRLRGRFSHSAPEGTDEPLDGADEAPEADGDSNRSWLGGAARRGDLRLVDEEEQPGDEELRDAVLALGDDALIAHDIWFVALGGSSLDHAGMQDFVARHRSEIRGCFVINLDCVGAGRLATLKSEGLEQTRRSDRRITRLLNNAAADLHIELGQETHDWADTDATPAMRSSLRSVTLMGVGDNGLPALSRTPDDLFENVDGDQAADVAALVTEVIRRS